jgi:hypothetical protein
VPRAYETLNPALQRAYTRLRLPFDLMWGGSFVYISLKISMYEEHEKLTSWRRVPPEKPTVTGVLKKSSSS